MIKKRGAIASAIRSFAKDRLDEESSNRERTPLFVLKTGKLYAVFGKRQGRIIAAENAHGFGGHFRVLATLPVQESFHLARELRTQTSGLASPQLVFSHWEVSVLISIELRLFLLSRVVLSRERGPED